MDIPIGWTLKEWQNAYLSGAISPKTAMETLLAKIDRTNSEWISLVSPAELERQLAELEKLLSSVDGNRDALALFGIPFAVKDNIDAVGMSTTAACPAFAYSPSEDATVVARLKSAGAILIGKTNLDQFATGLVGTRSPYGTVPNTFNPDYVSGGSSSGSAVVVAKGLVPFSLGTDTAGSGRVPAAFNNIVGLKPTRGALSTYGVVPACRSLDCVSVMALTVEDAETVSRIVCGYDQQDPYSRVIPKGPSQHRFSLRPRFAIPAEPRWFGDKLNEAAYRRALEKFREMGIELRPIDFTPMHEMAALLYGGPWVAERLAVIEEFANKQPEAIHPIVRKIIIQGKDFTAVDTFRAEYQRVALARIIQAVFKEVDALLVPSTPTFPTLEEVNAEPVEANSRLGTYTNFVNLSDCCALALPAGFRSDKLPFGITLIAPSWHDGALIEFALRWQKSAPWPLGATQRTIPTTPKSSVIQPESSEYVRLAVAGAHLAGMPLNYQLTEREASFVECTTTAPCYRLYELTGTVPSKPGLIRDIEGAAIEVELWDVPVQHFGSFVAAVPAPLGIGTIKLIDGREVKGFICEGLAVTTARDITSFGGWRAFMRDESTYKNQPA